MNKQIHRFAVRVLPREVILDTQGRAIEQTLKQNEMPVKSLRVGKYITLEVEASHLEDGKQQVKKMAEFLLYNPLIENYEIEVIS